MHYECCYAWSFSQGGICTTRGLDLWNMAKQSITSKIICNIWKWYSLCKMREVQHGQKIAYISYHCPAKYFGKILNWGFKTQNWVNQLFFWNLKMEILLCGHWWQEWQFENVANFISSPVTLYWSVIRNDITFYVWCTSKACWSNSICDKRKLYLYFPECRAGGNESHYSYNWPFTTTLIFTVTLSYYHPPTKLREGNVFSRVCLSIGGEFHVTTIHDAL